MKSHLPLFIFFVKSGMKAWEMMRRNMAVFIILLFVLTMITHSYAVVSDIGSLPPSKHIMCYEQFIKDILMLENLYP